MIEHKLGINIGEVENECFKSKSMDVPFCTNNGEGVSTFYSYIELCEDYLNTGLSPDDENYRDTKDLNRLLEQALEDIDEYFCQNNHVWFVIYE